MLEYIECPEQPRPVHGDVCSPQATRCEMARVRETVRLRLVPPRPYKPKGPIDDFLKELVDLRKNPDMAPFLPPDPSLTSPAATTPTSSSTPPPDLLPFRVEVEVQPANAPNIPNTTLSVQPRSNTAVVDSRNLPFRQVKSAIVRVVTDAGASFSAGNVLLTVRPTGQVNPPAQVATVPNLTWNSELINPSGQVPSPTSVFQFDAWRLSPGSGTPQLIGSAMIRLVLSTSNDDVSPLGISMEIVTQVSVAEQPTLDPFPCLGEPCCPENSPRFPTWPPFLHADPLFRPQQPADPKVLALSILYAWLAAEAKRHRLDQPGPDGIPGTADDPATSSPALTQAAQIYQAAWQGLFGIQPEADLRPLSELLQRLLAAWCRSFLYPGPSCAGEPHGVVIGCVRVEAGDIREVDPWGGRRYVLHGPLLNYWGEQVGIAALDVTVGRLVSLVCCLACLPLPAALSSPDLNVRPGTINLNSSLLIRGSANEVNARLAEVNVQPVRTETISGVDFASRVVTALRQPASPLQPGQPVVRYTVEGMPDLNLIVPAPQPTTGTSSGGTTIDRSRVAETVRTNLTDLPEGPVSPLLRPLSEDVSVNLLDALPLSALPGAASPARAPLDEAGVRTAASVLAANPDDLHENVLGGREAEGLNRVLTASEDSARTVALTVGNVVREMSEANRLTSRSDLQKDDIREEMVKNLNDRLSKAKIPITEDAIRKALDDAARLRR